jgi:hypothetical protein
MKKKRLYISPETETIVLNLGDPLQQGIGVNGSGLNEDEQLGRETGGSFFDDEEFDDGFLNGGPNMFTDWEDKDRL